MEQHRLIFQSDFYAFCRKALRELDGTEISPDAYVEYLTAKLTKFADQEIKKLLINLPPRHLKTGLAAICLAAWVLAHWPQTEILVVTYSDDLARQISRSIRSILKAAWFRAIFDTRLAKDHAAVADFATTAGGQVRAAPINGNVTGFGADVIICDDPHNITDAAKPKKLARTIELFRSVVDSRLNNRKKGQILVIAHRIHENDLSATLLRDPDWDRITLPAIAPRDQTLGSWHRRKGTLLRPDAFVPGELEKHATQLVNPTFDLLYQQDVDAQSLPAIVAGHFRFQEPGGVRHLPCVISVDAATGKRERRSYSVVQVWAYDQKFRYLLEQLRERCDFHELALAVSRISRRYYRCPILIEDTANGPALISELKRNQRRLVYEITPRGSKSQRLRPHLEKIINGDIYLPTDAASACPSFVKEFIEFPYGQYSDQVDAFSQAMTWIAEYGEQFSKTRSDVRMPIAVAYGSQYTGLQPQHRVDPKAPGVVALRHSLRLKLGFDINRGLLHPSAIVAGGCSSPSVQGSTDQSEAVEAHAWRQGLDGPGIGQCKLPTRRVASAGYAYDADYGSSASGGTSFAQAARRSSRANVAQCDRPLR